MKEMNYKRSTDDICCIQNLDVSRDKLKVKMTYIWVGILVADIVKSKKRRSAGIIYWSLAIYSRF